MKCKLKRYSREINYWRRKMTIIDEQLVKEKIFKKQYRDLIPNECIKIECKENLYNQLDIRIKLNFSINNSEKPTDDKYKCGVCVRNPNFENRIFTNAFVKTKECEKCIIKIGDFKFHFTYDYQIRHESYMIDLVKL